MFLPFSLKSYAPSEDTGVLQEEDDIPPPPSDMEDDFVGSSSSGQVLRLVHS